VFYDESTDELTPNTLEIMKAVAGPKATDAPKEEPKEEAGDPKEVDVVDGTLGIYRNVGIEKASGDVIKDVLDADAVGNNRGFKFTSSGNGSGTNPDGTPVDAGGAGLVIPKMNDATQDIYNTIAARIDAYNNLNTTEGLRVFNMDTDDAGNVTYTSELPAPGIIKNIINYQDKDASGVPLKNDAVKRYMMTNKMALVNQYYSDKVNHANVLISRAMEEQRRLEGGLSSEALNALESNLYAKLDPFNDIVGEGKETRFNIVDTKKLFQNLGINTDAMNDDWGLVDGLAKSKLKDAAGNSVLGVGLITDQVTSFRGNSKQLLNYFGNTSDAIKYGKTASGNPMTTQEMARMIGSGINYNNNANYYYDLYNKFIDTKGRVEAKRNGGEITMGKIQKFQTGGGLAELNTKRTDLEDRLSVEVVGSPNWERLNIELDVVEAEIANASQAPSPIPNPRPLTEAQAAAEKNAMTPFSLRTVANNNVVVTKPNDSTGKSTVEENNLFRGKVFTKTKEVGTKVKGTVKDIASGVSPMDVSDAVQLALMLRTKNKRIGTARIKGQVATPGFVPSVEAAKKLDLTDAKRDAIITKRSGTADGMTNDIVNSMYEANKADTLAKLNLAQAQHMDKEKSRVHKETEMSKGAMAQSAKDRDVVVNQNINQENQAAVTTLAANKANDDEFYQNAGQLVAARAARKSADSDSAELYTKLQIIEDSLGKANYRGDKNSIAILTAQRNSIVKAMDLA
jgi:hypothetical protein